MKLSDIPNDMKQFIPSTCKYCGTDLTIINDKHLACENENCSHTKYKLFEEGVNFLGMFGVGNSIIKDIWNAGFHNAIDLLDKKYFSLSSLIATPYFQNGKSVSNLLIERDKITNLHLQTIIRLLGFKGMGTTTSKQIALKVAGDDYSFKGLEKSVVSGFEIGDTKRSILETAIKRISEFVTIIYPETTKGKIKVEFTGSPKGAGFKSKGEFLSYIKTNGVIHTKLNDADYLITDNLNGTSSKMKTALKKGIKIVSYEQFTKLI